MTTEAPSSGTSTADQPIRRPTSENAEQSMAREFAAYLRELPRLLAEGHAQRYALIKGDSVLSVWDTQHDVLQAGHELFGLEPFAVKRIDPRDPERWVQLQDRKADHA